MEQLLQVGVISSTHGLKGEVKVFPTTDDANRFKKLKEVILDTGKEQRTLEIQTVKFFKQFVILKFKGMDTIEDVEKYRGKSLLVSRENAVKLEKDEFFTADLINCEVYTEQEERIGILTDVLETGANDVYIVKGELESEILLPAIKECILSVDLENRKIIAAKRFLTEQQ